MPDPSRRLFTRTGFFSPSLDGGLPLFELFNPSRRSSSAIRAFSAAFSALSAPISAISSSPDGSLSNSRIIRFFVTAQVGDLVQDRRRDFAKDVGSQVRASMMAQPCFLAVEKNERMSAKSTAPSTERKPPEIFWRNFIMRPSRSA